MTFGPGPVLPSESEPSKAHFKIGPELILRQVAFKAPAFFAVGVEYKDGGRPECVEAAEIFRILFNVDAERDEILFDERRQTGVFVRLLFEPQTGTSLRRRTEIDKQRFILFFCLLKRLVGVFDPID
jgi:hypothetical protein